MEKCCCGHLRQWLAAAIDDEEYAQKNPCSNLLGHRGMMQLWMGISECSRIRRGQCYCGACGSAADGVFCYQITKLSNLPRTIGCLGSDEDRGSSGSREGKVVHDRSPGPHIPVAQNIALVSCTCATTERLLSKTMQTMRKHSRGTECRCRKAG